jgi:hypothetical protein
MYGVLHEQPDVPLLEAGFYRPDLLDRFGKVGSVSFKKNSAALSGWDADQARRGHRSADAKTHERMYSRSADHEDC